MLQVTLFTKTGCDLCDNVKTILDGLAPRFPHQLDCVDISSDPDLLSRYRYSIPVVVVGEVVLEAPISDQQLVEALNTAVSPT